MTPVDSSPSLLSPSPSTPTASAAISDERQDAYNNVLQQACGLQGQHQQHELQDDDECDSSRPAAAPPSSASVCFKFRKLRQSRATLLAVVCLAVFTDMLVYGVIVPILPFMVSQLGRDPQDIGFLFGCYAFGLLVSTPIVGVLSDKLNAQRFFFITGLLILSLSTILFGFAQTYWQLVFARIIQGAAGGCSWTVGLSVLADNYPSGHLGVVLGTVLSANTVGSLVGPVIGGVLYQKAGHSVPFLVCGSISLMTAIARFITIDPPQSHNQSRFSTCHRNSDDEETAEETRPLITGHMESDHVISDANESYHHEFSRQNSNHSASHEDRNAISFLTLITDRSIFVCCFLTGVFAAVISAIEATLPVFLVNNFRANPTEIGLLYCAIIIPSLVMYPLFGFLSDSFGRKELTASGLILYSVSTPLLALPRAMWLEVAALVILGITSSIPVTPIMPRLAEQVRELGGGSYARVYAVWNMAYSVGMLVGPSLAGVLVARFNFFVDMMVFAVALFLCVPTTRWL